MIEKLNYDFTELFIRSRSTYDGIVEMYAKINELVDAVNILRYKDGQLDHVVLEGKDAS